MRGSGGPFRAGAARIPAAARPLLRAPYNMRLDGTLRRSLAGAWVLSPYFVGILISLAISDDAAGTTRLFAAKRGNLPDIFAVEKRRPPPNETRRGAVNDSSTGDHRRYRIKKLGLNAPTR